MVHEHSASCGIPPTGTEMTLSPEEAASITDERVSAASSVFGGFLQCAGSTAASYSGAFGRDRKSSEVVNLVVHTTEGSRTSAVEIAKGNPAHGYRGQGWDILTDHASPGWALQCNDWNKRISHHAGHWPMNRESIGWETVGFASKSGQWTEEYYKWMGKVRAEIKKLFPNIPMKRVRSWRESGDISHRDVYVTALGDYTGRYDPGDGFRWDLMYKWANYYLNNPDEPVTPPTPTDPDAPPKPEPPKPEPPTKTYRMKWPAGESRDYTHRPTVDEAAETLKGYGVEAIVTESGEKSAPPQPPKPEPPAPKPVDPQKAATVDLINSYFGTNYGAEIYEEANRAGLHIAAACALVEQESNGRNIFGCDLGPRSTVPFCRQEVTKERVAQLVRHIRAGGTSNGVGLTQLTWRDFVYEAEALGGAHIPRNQLRVGFKLLASYFDRYGEPDGWGAYNAGEGNRASVRNTYSAACMAKRDAWRKRLAKTEQNQEVNVQEPGPAEPETPARRGPNMEPVAWGTIAKSLVMVATVIAASYSIEVTPDLQSALILVLTEVLVALGAMGGIGAAERASVTPTVKIEPPK